LTKQLIKDNMPKNTLYRPGGMNPEGEHFEISKLVNKASNFSTEDKDDAITDEEALDLHNVISGHIASSDVIYNINVSNLREDTTNKINQALAANDTGAVEVLNKQLDAVEDLSRLMESQGKKYADAFLNSESLAKEQAEELTEFIRETSRVSDILGEAVNVKLTDFLKTQSKNISDERLFQDYRRDVAEDIVRFANKHDVLEDSEHINIIEDLLEKRVLDEKDFNEISESIDDLREDLNIDESIHELGKALIAETSTEVMEAKLQDLLDLMEKSSKYEKEQIEVMKLMNREDMESDDDFQDSMRLFASKLTDKTMETKINYSLDKLNDNVDKSILTEQNLAEKFDDMEDTFKENSESVSSASNITQGLLSAGLSSIYGPLGYIPFIAEKLGGGGLLTGAAAMSLWNRFRGKDKADKKAKAPKEVAKPGIAKRFVGKTLEKLKGKKNWAVAGAGAVGLGVYNAFSDDDDVENMPEDSSMRESYMSHVPQRQQVGYDVQARSTGRSSYRQASNMHVPNPDGVYVGRDGIDTALDTSIAGLGAYSLYKHRGSVAGNVSKGAKSAVEKATKLKNSPSPLKGASVSGVTKNVMEKASKADVSVKGAVNAGKNLLRRAGSFATVGMGVYDYATADSKAERLRAAASTAGAGLGAVGGGVATGGLGAFVGGWLGAEGGKWFANTFLIDPEDYIPDEVKEVGPLAEAVWVSRGMHQGSFNEFMDEDDKDDLLKYRDKKLLSESNLKNFLMSSGLQDLPKGERIEELRSRLMRIGINYYMPDVYNRLLDMQVKVNEGTMKLRPVRVGGRTVSQRNNVQRINRSNVVTRPIARNVKAVRDESSVDVKLFDDEQSGGVDLFGGTKLTPSPVSVRTPGGLSSTTTASQTLSNNRPIIINNSGSKRPTSSGGVSKPALSVDDYSIALANSLLFT